MPGQSEFRAQQPGEDPRASSSEQCEHHLPKAIRSAAGVPWANAKDTKMRPTVAVLVEHRQRRARQIEVHGLPAPRLTREKRTRASSSVHTQGPCPVPAQEQEAVSRPVPQGPYPGTQAPGGEPRQQEGPRPVPAQAPCRSDGHCATPTHPPVGNDAISRAGHNKPCSFFSGGAIKALRVSGGTPSSGVHTGQKTTATTCTNRPC